ncbi:lipid A-modifier LpxR family protein [Flammeovirga kamogawensis]|uniref:Lipid A deacylase LpxR family protein n=1 Tax=Flammeovirga kamogawensis TaxID=373891 RepID=A0ABX8GPR2_9BACT|nr:lipid A-modifier LpxR family protein [Flammeovirga kamogawensis]MBB6463469.1 hypothetical protein [Flammeovirga kamogawensis]QWG05605.1 lipid A deacylase LpxR family protein [Flammeovirga kamogawensis]TRX67437.1 lipid A deacylase LpxR family protein [Flammeovirga kamogawensis]
MKFHYYFFLLFTLIFNTTVLAQENDKDKEPFYIRLTVDEDLFLVQSTDQFYSFGAEIKVGFKGLDNKFTRSFLFAQKEGHSLFDFGIVHKMYTPRNSQLTEVDSSDIPYCGVTYLSLTRQAFNPSNGIVIKTRLDVGFVGELSGAKTFQNGFHNLIGNGSIDGWDNQIANGLYLNYTAEVMHNFISSFKYSDVFLVGRGTVGTMDMSFEGSLFLRLGIFNDYFIQAERPYSKKTNLDNFYSIRKTRYSKAKYAESFWIGDEEVRRSAISNWVHHHFKPNQFYVKFITGAELNLYDGEMSGSLISFESSPYVIPYNMTPKLLYKVSIGFVLSYHFGSLEYNWDRITYDPESNFPPYYPKWGRFNINLNL